VVRYQSAVCVCVCMWIFEFRWTHESNENVEHETFLEILNRCGRWEEGNGVHTPLGNIWRKCWQGKFRGNFEKFVLFWEKSFNFNKINIFSQIWISHPSKVILVTSSSYACTSFAFNSLLYSLIFISPSDFMLKYCHLSMSYREQEREREKR
jgi:hypothetical protein